MRTFSFLPAFLASLLTAGVWLGLPGLRARAQNPDLAPGFGSVKLRADFAPDPFEKDLVAGGPIKTGLGGVNAHVSNAPDFSLHYTAGNFALTIRVESKADTTLLINLPDGTWVADDDSGGNLNPLLKWGRPQTGRYDIFVGTIGKEAAPARLQITERVTRLADKPGPVVTTPYGATAEEINRGRKEAMSLKDQGRYYEAVAIAEQLLPLAERVYGKDHLDTASVLNDLGLYYEAIGQNVKAEPLYRRSLEIREIKYGKGHHATAIPLFNLAGVYIEMGQYAKSESLFLRMLAIDEARYGKDDPTTADTLNALASLYCEMGQLAKAEPLYVRSLEILEAKLGKEPQTARFLNNLAKFYRDRGLYAKAEPLYLRSLAILEAKLGQNHHDTALVLSALGGLYDDTHQHAKAEPLHRRSLEIREAKLGKDHPLVAASLNSLAAHYHDRGEYAKAEPFYRRCLTILEVTVGKDHQYATSVLAKLAVNSAHQKEWLAAVEQTHNARQSLANHLAHVLPSLSEKEQLNFLETTFERDFHRALSLGWAAPNDAGAASAEWLLNGKALAHQCLAEQHLLARDAANPGAKQRVDDLQNTRTQLATLINRLPIPGTEKEHRQQMQRLKNREDDLAQKLARAVGRPYRPNPWVTLEEFRGKLGSRTAFIDVSRFAVWDFTAKQSKGSHYVAWITPPQGKGTVKVIDLGPAEPIEQLVAETRKTLLDSAASVTMVGEAKAADALIKPLQALSAKVLHPLLPHIQMHEDWIVCPDGALWLVPWNALMLPDGAFAIEKHLVRHVVSGRELVQEQLVHKTESSFIFADPDYDLAPGKVVAAAGVHGAASRLVGQRLRGTIGAWNVSFEFRAAEEVIIYDEDAQGVEAGRGTWKHRGEDLEIKTALSHFEAKLAVGEIRGQRIKRNDGGGITRDAFRLALPDDGRSAGAVSKTLPRVKRLPGTALEAEAIRPHLAKWLGADPRVILEGAASEASVKSVKNPRVLTLATHGYFLPAQQVETTDKGRELGQSKRAGSLLDESGQPIEAPLLRCGLLLAACNKRAEAMPGEDDGILTGLEIAGMDLRGTELVVLSACETALGDVRSGEGVAGLRQAFQLAGARGVLATLWQVRDIETALLMNAFYGELTKGKSHAAALREAQLSRIAARRVSFGAAHPFFWGAFTLTSRGPQ